MFVTFTYLFFFVDLRSVCVDFSLDSVHIGCYGMRFSQMFWKIAVWTQSATDDPEIQNLLLLLPGTSDSPPMKGFFTLVCVPRICRRFLKFAYIVMHLCMRKVYSLLVRGVSRSKTLIPLILSQSGWMLYYNNK